MVIFESFFKAESLSPEQTIFLWLLNKYSSPSNNQQKTSFKEEFLRSISAHMSAQKKLYIEDIEQQEGIAAGTIKKTLESFSPQIQKIIRQEYHIMEKKNKKNYCLQTTNFIKKHKNRIIPLVITALCLLHQYNSNK
jgi:hypothetical protein